jgi:beta-phosphoglucomutase-like phosphatase (HAD superfamily)
MFSGYIFDVEGTLVDSVPHNLRSFQEALEQVGLTVPLLPSSSIPVSTATRRFRLLLLTSTKRSEG